MTNSILHLHEKVLAARLLVLSASRASSALDQFSNWLLAGFGATFALLLTNVETIAKNFTATSIRFALLGFSLSLLLGVLSRFLGAFVASSASAANEADKLGADASNAGHVLDFQVVFKEIVRAFFWPMRLLAASSMRKLEKDDLTLGARLCSRLTQTQGVLVLLQVLIAIMSASALAWGLDP